MNIKKLTTILILNFLLLNYVSSLDCPFAAPILDSGNLLSSVPVNLERCFTDVNMVYKCVSIYQGSLVKGQIQTTTYGVFNKKVDLTYTGERICMRFGYERVVVNCGGPSSPGNLNECREYCYPLSQLTFKVNQIDAFSGCSTIFTDYLQATWTI